MLGAAALALLALAAFAATSAFGATITSFTGTIGRASSLPYCYGSTLTVSGSGFVNDGGTLKVTVGGVPAANVVVGSDSTLYVLVGAGAQSGPVVVTTGLGSVTSSQTEQIVPCASGPPSAKPAITSLSTKSAKGGQKIELLGSGFVGTTGVTVGGITASYAIPSDVNMYVVIPKSAKNGSLTIAVTSPVGTGQSTVKKTG